MKSRDFYLINSLGGCGTTFLLHFFSKYIKTNDPDNRDGLKHIRYAPDLSFVKKAIYVFGDPKNTIVYHFSKRDQGWSYWPIQHCKNIDGKWGELSPAWDLNDYLANGKDLYLLEDHFDSWFNSKNKDYKIMFVRYETMWSHLPEIFDFLEVDQKEIEKFPPQRQRKSNWGLELDENRNMILKMYGSFSKKIDDFEDIKII